MRILLIVLLIASNLFVYAQEKVFHEQIGNKIGLKTYDSTEVYSPIVVFKGKELSLTSFEHAYFSPNRELVAIVTSDPELYYRNKKTFDELEDRIVIYDFKGVPIKTILSKPIANLAINDKGEFIASEIIGFSRTSQSVYNIQLYNENGYKVGSKALNFIGTPILYFINDSVLIVYGECTLYSHKEYREKGIDPTYSLLIYNNLKETGEKFFPISVRKGIFPSIQFKKPVLSDSLIKVYSIECTYDSDLLLERTSSKCDSIILYINFNGEMIKTEEKW